MKWEYEYDGEVMEFPTMFDAIDWMRGVILDFEDGPALRKEMEDWLAENGWDRVDLLIEAEFHDRDFTEWVSAFAEDWVKWNMREVRE